MMSYKILLITTGGTIAQTHDEHGIAISGASNGLEDTINQIIELLNNHDQELHQISSVDIKSIMNKDSSNIIPEDWVDIINVIVKEYDNYDAFVVTHGTNTLGYTCAALSFALGNLGKPVVLTGSQVSYGYPSSDARMNMESAFRIAAYKEEKIAGVMAVFGSNIITGTRVKKTTEFDFDAFKAFNTANTIGRIGNSIRINSESLAQHMSFLKPMAHRASELKINNDFDMHIVSLTEFPGMSSSIFQSLVESSFTTIKGFVFRATGAGDPNIAPIGATFENLREGFEYLQNNQIPIVVTTQAPDGIASMDINNPGNLARELGAIPAHDMSMESMTVKLAWLLAQKKSYQEIRELMVHSFRGEIRPK